jgi:hypothetical protein
MTRSAVSPAPAHRIFAHRIRHSHYSEGFRRAGDCPGHRAPPPNAKSIRCKDRRIPQLEDITPKCGVNFSHSSSPESRYIIESMSGGVLLLDYDRDGWLDIYFTNAPKAQGALKGEKARSALYHNNHDGKFTDVTDKAGVGFPCFAMGGAVADFDNDGWPDIYVTCYGGNVLYHNNGDGTFTDIAKKAGVTDGSPTKSTGEAAIFPRAITVSTSASAKPPKSTASKSAGPLAKWKPSRTSTPTISTQFSKARASSPSKKSAPNLQPESSSAPATPASIPPLA